MLRAERVKIPLFVTINIFIRLDFLERYSYEIDIKSGYMQEIEEPTGKIAPVYIPEDIDVKEIFFGENKEYVIEDVFGNIYVPVKEN